MPTITLVAMSGLRVGHKRVLAAGMRLPGLRKRAQALEQLPPLGLLTIAGGIPPEWTLHFVEDDVTSPPQQLAEQILDSKPDIVAFSALTPSVDRAAEVSRQVRSRKIPTVIGGLHATALPEWCRTRFTSVVIGDGEPSISRVLSDFASGTLQPFYRPIHNFDISDSPLPAWELRSRDPGRFTLQTARGCPWACSFCAASRLLGPGRIKSTASIKRELDQIASLRRRAWLELADDNTFAFTRDHSELLELLRESGVRWFTESDWRIADNPFLLKAIASSGCQQILIGVESTIFRYPGMGKKNVSFGAMVKAIEKIQSHGIIVNACFIVGADGETEASIQRLTDFLCQANFGEIQVTLQTPFPGSSLYKQMQRENRLLYDDFSRYTLFDVVFAPDLLTPEQLQNAFIGLVETVFAAPQQTRRNKIRKAIRLRAKQQ